MLTSRLVVALITMMLLVGQGPMGASAALEPAQAGGESAPSLCAGDAHHAWLAVENSALVSHDGGKSWIVSFWGRFWHAHSFEAPIGCAGEVAWVPFRGPGGAMSQEPYVVYRTADGGRHWRAMMEEGYFSVDYPDAHTRLPER